MVAVRRVPGIKEHHISEAESNGQRLPWSESFAIAVISFEPDSKC